MHPKKDGILAKKYRQYLIPSILTSLALALNEFVDCMLVSNLLDSDALAIANLGCPVILIIASCYVLLGSGGATLYAIYLGKWEKEKAGKVFTVSMILAVMLGLAILLICTLAKGPITSVLCVDEALRPAFTSYYQILLLTAPVLVLMLTFLCYLPPSGAPVIATTVNIVANGLNLVMDIVYIRVFGMGVEGAAWATITGYLIGAVVMAVLIKKKNVEIVRHRVHAADFYIVPMICTQGAATAFLQICYAIKYAFSNNIAAVEGGRVGVVAFSLCLQSFSIASVFLLGVADAAQPFLAMLSGQKDYKGERAVLMRSFRLQVMFAVILIALFLIFPQGMTILYGLKDPTVVQMGMRGIRLFCLTYLTRGVAIQFMRFFQVEQRKGYAFFISMMDGLFVIPIGYFLSRSIGLDGVFISYPISAALMLLVIVIINSGIYLSHKDQYADISLVREDRGDTAVLNLSITDDDVQISAASEEMIEFCSEHGIAHKIAMKVGLMCEEMAVYTHHHRKERGDIDFLLRIKEDIITMNFRSIGEPFDPTSQADDDMAENFIMLNSLPHNLSYDYIMGMNNTQITMERG